MEIAGNARPACPSTDLAPCPSAGRGSSPLEAHRQPCWDGQRGHSGSTLPQPVHHSGAAHEAGWPNGGRPISGTDRWAQSARDRESFGFAEPLLANLFERSAYSLVGTECGCLPGTKERSTVLM